MKYLLGKKIGMTRIYNDAGKAIPVTVVEAGPIYITQIQLNAEVAKVQIGYGTSKKLAKPQRDELTKLDIKQPLKHRREIDVDKSEAEELKSGQTITVSAFQPGDIVDISGLSKGKGFAGTIKRHGFTRGPKTHGSHNIRQPGSIGSTFPQRVIKGKRMAGHMGYDQVTIKKLEVKAVDPERNLLIVNGAIPGARGTLVTIKGA